MAEPVAPKPGPSLRYRLASLLILLTIFCAIEYGFDRPASVKPEGWRLFALFTATIVGLILQPIPGGAIVLIAVTLSTVLGCLTVQQALLGWSDPTVWMVMAAFFISIAMIKSGLARRIALFFVRLFGKTSLGVTYALSLTDMILATIIPSNGARSGGVVLPIARSLAELYGSHPGPTAARLGTFLMTSVYQNICVTAAMFMTGQASNPLAVQIAASTFGYQVNLLTWASAGIVPGLCSLALVPMLIQRLAPPGIRKTPEAAEFAAGQLREMGPMDRAQQVVLLIFVTVCGLWIATPWHGLDISIPALIGACGLLASGILRWDDVVSDRVAWDILVWYGGLVRLGKALGETGIPTEFAKAVGGWFPGEGWVALFAVALLVYFYAHYGFASITAHILAMLAPFVGVLLVKGAPIGLVFFAFACFSNLAAGLTTYGTTPSPMYFATNYVTFRAWWTAGFLASLMNIAIWSTVGFWWWKLIGLW
ncbi:MAG: DASS family sodium-coupled anion symporter [Bryobacteraceae bacterium]